MHCQNRDTFPRLSIITIAIIMLPLALAPRRALAVAMFLALVGLTGCGTPVGTALAPPALSASVDEAGQLAERFSKLHQASPQAQLFKLDAEASTLAVHVFRAGRAAALGHNHVLQAPALQGWALLSPGALGQTQMELLFRLDELQLDAPAQRARLGPGWASELSPAAVAATRSNMLGTAGLQAELYPWVSLRAVKVVGELPKLAVQVEIELHGQTRSQWLALEAKLDDQRLNARGALVLRQSDFGLTPFSVGAGLLAVADELLVEFDLVARSQPH